MRAEDTLQYMADFYPDIFPTRKHCLDHLFCVVGNGYKWVNGKLVDDGSVYKKRYKLRKHIKKASFPHEERWKENNKFYSELYKDEPHKIPVKYRFNWYPLSVKYSKLYNIPNDITDDWKELLFECVDMLIADGVIDSYGK